jgi:hypothetical protein
MVDSFPKNLGSPEGGALEGDGGDYKEPWPFVKFMYIIYISDYLCIILNMITIPEAVEGVIRASPFLDEALALGIVNLSALARLIKPDVERTTMKKVQDGAVIIALNRLRRRVASRARRQRSVFKRAPELTVRSNLMELTYANSERMFARRKTLLERHGGRTSVFLTVTQGIRETTIVAGRELREPIQAIFKGERVLDRIDDLSSVTVLLPAGTAAVPGVYHYILKALAWEGVNIVEVVSTLNEFTIVLADRDIDKAFSLIKRLF